MSNTALTLEVAVNLSRELVLDIDAYCRLTGNSREVLLENIIRQFMDNQSKALKIYNESQESPP